MTKREKKFACIKGQQKLDLCSILASNIVGYNDDTAHSNVLELEKLQEPLDFDYDTDLFSDIRNTIEHMIFLRLFLASDDQKTFFKTARKYGEPAINAISLFDELPNEPTEKEVDDWIRSLE